MKGSEKKCLVCGKIFDGKKRKSNYCCQSCAAIARWQLAKGQKVGPPPSKPKKVCEICGKPIQGDTRKKCCSEECAKELRRRKYREWYAREAKNYEKICPICRKTFMPHNRGTIYCGPACRAKHQAALREDKRKEQANSTVFRDVRVIVPRTVAGVREDMQPIIGKIYDAKIGRSPQAKMETIVIPSIGRLGLILKPSEVRIVDDEE